MAWSWRYERSDGTEVLPVAGTVPQFPTQADAESWVGEVWRDLREGFGYVRRHVWLWGTLASAGVAYLLFPQVQAAARSSRRTAFRVPANATESTSPVALGPTRYTEGDFIVSFEPMLPSIHSM